MPGMPGTWGGGDLRVCGGPEFMYCTGWGAGIGIPASGHRSLYLFSHSVLGNCQTWEYRAATWPGRKNSLNAEMLFMGGTS